MQAVENYVIEERGEEFAALLQINPSFNVDFAPLAANKKFLVSGEYEEVAKMLTELTARKCRKDINVFLSYCMFDPQTAKPIRQAPIHYEMQDNLTNSKRVIILFPREHGKTSQLIGRAVWEVGNNHDHRIKIVCAADSLAQKRVVAIREMIGSNPRVKKVFPDLIPHDTEDTWSKTRITVQRKVSSPDPTVEGAGILSSATGGRCSILIMDDPVDAKNAIQQPALREQVKSAFRDVWMNLLFKDAVAWYIATPWHEDDLTMELKKEKETWKVMEYPVDDNHNSVWEEQWPSERLRAKEIEIGKRAYARGFRLLPISDEEMTFPTLPKAQNWALSVEDVLELSPNGYNYMGVDLAISKRVGSAFTVLFTTHVDLTGKRYPISIVRGKFSSITTAVLVLAYGAKWDCDVIKIENNAYQDALLEWIDLLKDGMLAPLKKAVVKAGGKEALLANKEKRDEFTIAIADHMAIIQDKIIMEVDNEQWDVINTWLPLATVTSLPIHPHLTGSQKADDLLGLPNVAAEVSNGDWIIPMRGHEESNPNHDKEHCGMCQWFGEARFHPFSKFSDIIMAWWMSREALRGGSGEVRML